MDVRLNVLNINVMSHNSGVFSGSNHQPFWRTACKTNVGFGRVVGEMNHTVNTTNVILDNDIVDFSRSEGQQGMTKQRGTNSHPPSE